MTQLQRRGGVEGDNLSTVAPFLFLRACLPVHGGEFPGLDGLEGLTQFLPSDV
jgi:hypothetical protein